MGKTGRNRISTKNKIDSTEFLNKAKYREPVPELIDKVSAELAVMGITEDMEVIDSAAQEIYKMCGDSGE